MSEEWRDIERASECECHKARCEGPAEQTEWARTKREVGGRKTMSENEMLREGAQERERVSQTDKQRKRQRERKPATASERARERERERLKLRESG